MYAFPTNDIVEQRFEHAAMLEGSKLLVLIVSVQSR